MTEHPRAALYRALPDRPQERRAFDGAVRGAARVEWQPLEIREVTRNGMTTVRVGGYASVTESPYEMYDIVGPYTEVVSRGAFGATLASSPLVEFTVNHGAGGGLPMAHTRNGTLDLAEDETGLLFEAYVNPKRADVKILLDALERGDMAEASFKFRIDSGMWSPDWSQFRIDRVDLNRGDVSSVNFGANPDASSGLRAADAPVETRAAEAAPLAAAFTARGLHLFGH